MELTSEQLPEILKTEKESKRRRSPTVTGEGYKISSKSVSVECAEQLQRRVVPRENCSLSSSYLHFDECMRAKGFFCITGQFVLCDTKTLCGMHTRARQNLQTVLQLFRFYRSAS